MAKRKEGKHVVLERMKVLKKNERGFENPCQNNAKDAD